MGILRRLTASALAFPVLACEHTAPFSVPDYAPTTVLVPGDPARLTYSFGSDSRATWLPDGTGFLYSEERDDEPDHDRCLARMPVRGGAIVEQICAESDPDHDSLNAFNASSVYGESRIAYFRTAMSLLVPGNLGYERAAIMVAPYASPVAAAAAVQTLPYVSPSGQPINYIDALGWSGPATLVFLGERASYTCVNTGCTREDTTYAGVEIDRLDVAGDTGLLSEVPSTDLATAVAVGGPDTIFYALSAGGDVHRRVLSTGADTVVYTFAAAASGLSYAAGRLAATVSGGLYVVSLPNDSVRVLAAAGTIGPALSPDGRLLLAEVTDINNGFVPDLWLWTVQ